MAWTPFRSHGVSEVHDRNRTLFLSHASQDRALALRLCTELELFGWTVKALAREGLEVTHSSWRSAIGALLANADGCCALISPAYVASSPCMEELTEIIGGSLRERVVPVVVNGARAEPVHDRPVLNFTSYASGTDKRDLITLAAKIHGALIGDDSTAADPKRHRRIEYVPGDLHGVAPVRGVHLDRPRAATAVRRFVAGHCVVAVTGLPADGKSGLVREALLAVGAHHDGALPFSIVWIDCGDSTPFDFTHLAARVFEAIGPPPAIAARDAVSSFADLLNHYCIWLVLDQFDRVLGDGDVCSDPDLDRLLSLADRRLDDGRIILTLQGKQLIAGGMPMASMGVPAWTDDELHELLRSLFTDHATPGPDAVEAQQIIDWAGGNPYLVLLAQRYFAANRALPGRARVPDGPIEGVRVVVETLDDGPRRLLRLLGLVPFRLSESFIAEATQDINVDPSRDLAYLLRAGLCNVIEIRGVRYFGLPDVVRRCILEDVQLDAEETRADVTALVSRLTDAGRNFLIQPVEPVVPAAMFDRGRWHVSTAAWESVTRAVRCAEMFVAGHAAHDAREIILAEGGTLKYLNRFAPASYRRRFYSRLLGMHELEPWDRVNAWRGLALAFADAADFEQALRSISRGLGDLEATVESMDPPGRSTLGRLRIIEGYCLRHTDQSDMAVARLNEAIAASSAAGDVEAECKANRILATTYVETEAWTEARAAFARCADLVAMMSGDRKAFDEGRLRADTAIMAAHTGEAAQARQLLIDARASMVDAGDLWNERITSMNLIGACGTAGVVEPDQAGRLESLMRDCVALGNVLCVRAASENAEHLATGRFDRWRFVALG